MPEFSEHQQQARAFLKGLFEVLNDIIGETMKRSEKDLKSIQTNLSSVDSQFTDSESPLLEEVANHFEDYKNKIQNILINRPKPSPLPAEFYEISDTIKQEYLANEESQE